MATLLGKLERESKGEKESEREKGRERGSCSKPTPLTGHCLRAFGAYTEIAVGRTPSNKQRLARNRWTLL